VNIVYEQFVNTRWSKQLSFAAQNLTAITWKSTSKSREEDLINPDTSSLACAFTVIVNHRKEEATWKNLRRER